MKMWLQKRHYKRRKLNSKFLRYTRYLFRILTLILVVDIFYISYIWPDWSEYGRGSIKKTKFIESYELRLKKNSALPVLHWKPVPMNWIPINMRNAIIVAEDSRFYQHTGFDLDALKDAMEYNVEHLDFKYGASTISQQTIKNMFLSSARNPLRKWHELILTVGMEIKLSKTRILEIYLNVAEFGKGIFGVEAAAHHYYGVSVLTLSAWQAAELAASLPSPLKHNPKTKTQRFIKRSKKIYRYMQILSKNKKPK